MKRITLLLAIFCFVGLSVRAGGKDFKAEEYVSTLVGTLSDPSYSNGNQYPALALPWGMNFWTPQTGKNGDQSLDQRLRLLQRDAGARHRPV